MRKPSRRAVLITVLVLLLLPFAAVGVLVLVAESRWGERWVEARVGGILHREVQIEGIDVQLGRPLGIALERLRISNPQWAESPNLIDASRFYAQVEIAPLFRGKVVAPYVGARAATVGVERDGDRASWRFSEGERKESRLQLSRIFVQDGTVAYRDKPRGTSLDFAVNGSLGENEALEWTGTGTFKGEPAKGSGKITSLEPRPGLPIPIVAKATIGRAEITADGTVAPTLNDLDLKFSVAGTSLHQLQKIFGINLPDTPPFRLAGQLKRDDKEWNFTPFEGKVGDSDLRGSVRYVQGDKEGNGPKPLLQAKLQSKLLDFDDLGPLIGVPPKTGAGETASSAQKAKAASVKASDKVLPRMAFNTQRWHAMDADVTLVATRVQRPKQLPLDAFSAHLVLKDAVLKVDPLNFGFAGGKINTKVVLDATRKPTRGDIDLDIQGLQLSKLAPTSSTMQDALGTLYGRGKLKGTGESMGELLSTSDGQIGLAIDGGRVSALLVELAGLDFGEAALVLGSRRGTKSQVGLRCAAGALKIQDGVAEPEPFVVDTTDTVIRVTGHVNLGSEKIELVTTPEPKDVSIFSLRTPIEIGGTLKEPTVRPKTGPLVARVAIAGALAAVAPPLAALAMIETGPGKDTDCAKVLAEAKSAGAVKKS